MTPLRLFLDIVEYGAAIVVGLSIVTILFAILFCD